MKKKDEIIWLYQIIFLPLYRNNKGDKDMKRSKFFKSWNNRVLEDWGSIVSEDFNLFQNAFKRELNKIASDVNAKLVNYSKGHYDMSGFFERNGKYVYFHYSNFTFRTCVNLTSNNVMYVRKAKNEKDYRGETNYNVSFLDLKEKIDFLLK